MGQRIIKPSRQIEAAYKVGELEGRVAIQDATLKASDFVEYLNNCEDADIMADNKVLKYILDSGMLSLWRNFKLRKVYNNYKAKYWK